MRTRRGSLMLVAETGLWDGAALTHNGTGRSVTVNTACSALAVIIFMVFLSASAESAVIRVPADGPTIQEGTGAAASGDTVPVSPGTHSGPLNRDNDFGGANVVESCTMAGDIGEGAGIFCHTATADIVSTIIAFGHEGAVVGSWSGVSATLVCCDVYMNEYGDWCDRTAGQAGINGNISANPLFCGDADPLMRHMLHANSLCAAENSPGCGGIGAFGVGCDPTAVETISWGV